MKERDKTEEMINVQRMSLKLFKAIGFDPMLGRKLEAINWDRGLDANALHDLYRLLRLAEYRINENKY